MHTIVECLLILLIALLLVLFVGMIGVGGMLLVCTFTDVCRG